MADSQTTPGSILARRKLSIRSMKAIFPRCFAVRAMHGMPFTTRRFTIEEILGRSVALHRNSDDFRSQPSGNSGGIIACGVIRPA